jgi:hypothetical protein
VSAASRGAPSGSRAALAAIWLASLAVLAAVVLAAFRLGFGEDVGTLLTANGVCAGFAAGAGALLALAGALRQLGPGERPLRELDWLGAVAGAAGGGFAAAQLAAGVPALALFGLGAALGGGLGWRAARWLDRAQRGANLGALVFLGAALGVAALAGTYARARRDAVAPLVAWRSPPAHRGRSRRAGCEKRRGGSRRPPAMRSSARPPRARAWTARPRGRATQRPGCRRLAAQACRTGERPTRSPAGSACGGRR